MGRHSTIKIMSIVSIPLIYGWLSWTSASMPFSPSEEFLALINFGIYPVTIISFLTFVLFYKFSESGETGWQIRLNKCKTKGEKIKTGAIGIISIIVGFYCLMFPIRYYPALAIHILSNTSSQIQALVTEAKPLRKGQYTKIYYQNLDTQKKYEVHWPTGKSQQIQAGSFLTLTVNSNWFGYYVETLVIKN